MLAPAVVLLMVTDCALEYTPDGGENVGVATGGRVIVYVADPTVDVLNPTFVAIALIVCVDPTEIALVYGVDDGVGVEPSVV